MGRVRRALVLLALLAPTMAGAQGGGARVEVLESVGGLPAHISGAFEQPVAFQMSPAGDYFVFDRRAHAVYRIGSDQAEAHRILEIGHEAGRIIGPTAFALGPAATIIVADAPNMRERIQLFRQTGDRISGFALPGRATRRLIIGNQVLGGVSSLQARGQSLLISLPETGGLITEYSLSGRPVRTFGQLRRTGFEQDRDVHLALNSGLPLAHPDGGFYFVFQGGVPAFRRYDERGQLLFERHIEGRQVDPLVRGLPTTWPRRRGDDGITLPIIPPSVRTAAVDPDGRLWVTLTVPFTYVYDSDGEKSRVLQFQAAGLVQPTSLFFASRDRLLVTPGCYEFNP